MGVMAAPRKGAFSEEIPPEPIPFQELLDLYDRLDTGKCKAEVLEGDVIVSPMPVYWHEEVCQWLLLSFLPAFPDNDWGGDTAGEVKLPLTGDLIVPDFMILRGKKTLPRMERFRPLDRVLLAAEVVSESSIRRDRVVKPRICAISGIPFYLLVDRFTKPGTISLYSEPGKDGYAKVITVAAGAKLELPAPFDFTLDTSTVPFPA